MKTETKKDLKIVGNIYPELVQLQMEDYCPTSYRIVINRPLPINENDR